MNIDIEKLIEEDVKDKVNKTLREKALRNYYDNPNYCHFCNNIIVVNKNDSVSNTRKKKFCNQECSLNYQHDNAVVKAKRRELKVCKICGNKINSANQSGLCMSCLREEREKEKIRIWKETGNTGCGTATTIRNCIRDYIFEKQNKQCAVCHIDAIWNGKELHFILDHIDGDASNNFEDNLRLVCPNCDSQLDTYKSRNKNSARTHESN